MGISTNHKRFMNLLKVIFLKYQYFFVLVILIIISALALEYYYLANQHTLYGDAVSRLNISRKILDNLTPGIAQVGSIWLPLPQLLMLPFIWNNFLWHSGLAGSFMSMTAFIIGGFYLYKSMKILTNSAISSYLSLSIYALNINLLYYQTTAMSEPLFLCALSAAIYYFILWIKTKNKLVLIPAAIAVGAMTLTRYEGLAILLSSIPLVFFYTWRLSKNYHKAESNTILYAMVACLGFVIWTIYLTTIFGDPLYWKNYYAATPENGKSIAIIYQLSFFDTVWKYFTTVAWMNGLIPTILAVIAIPVLFFRSKKDKSYYFLPVLLSLSIFMFMILTLQKNTPINQPPLTIENILSPTTSKFNEFNIRYGLLMLPMITILCSYLFNVRFKAIKILLVLLLLIQFYSYISPSYSVIFQIPISIYRSLGPGGENSKTLVGWLKKHYDHGLIMVSALKHDPQMFQLGYNYKTYIHEGTGIYWKESIKDPRKHARWVILDYNNDEDQVTKFLKDSPILKRSYDLVYSENGSRIYKIKGKQND